MKSTYRDIIDFRSYVGSIPVRFTNHAYDRIGLSGIDIVEAKRMLYESVKSPFSVDVTRKKYLKDQHLISYWLQGDFVFTVKKTISEKFKTPIYLVITVTDQRTVRKYNLKKTYNEDRYLR